MCACAWVRARVRARARPRRAGAASRSSAPAEAEIVDDVAHVSILAATLGVEDGLSHLHGGGLARPAVKILAGIHGRTDADGRSARPAQTGREGPARAALQWCTHSPWEHSRRLAPVAPVDALEEGVIRPPI